ncbi:hypothetical protein EDD11_003243 [Mortierella claussenii]|nr:hypothetical protein EDD11_003243 [Mortierella claussenii]
MTAHIASKDKTSRPDQPKLADKGNLPSLPSSASSPKPSKDQNVEPSDFHASSRGNDAKDSRKQQPANTFSPDLSTASAPAAHQLHLDIESHQPLSAELGSLFSNTETVSTLFSPISASTPPSSGELPSLSSFLLRGEPCHTQMQTKTSSPVASTLNLASSSLCSTVDRNITAHSTLMSVAALQNTSNSNNSDCSSAAASKTVDYIDSAEPALCSTPSKTVSSTPSATTSAAPDTTATFTPPGSSVFPSSTMPSTKTPSLPSTPPQIDEKLQKLQSDCPVSYQITTQHHQQPLHAPTHIAHTSQIPPAGHSTMAYPSPPLPPTLPASVQADPESDSVSSHSTNPSQPQSQQQHQKSRPTISAACYRATTTTTMTMDSSESMSSPSSPSSASSVSSSSDSRTSCQLDDNAVPGPSMVRPLHIIPAGYDDFLEPIPQKSEDWAALIDTPASPVQMHHNRMALPPHLHQQQQQLREPVLTLEGYSESPAPEDGTASGVSSDYMQHQLSGQRPLHVHAQTDPAGMPYWSHPHQQHPNHPYQHHQHHQHHNSTPSVPLSNDGPLGPDDNLATVADPRKLYRKSWSANDALSGMGMGASRNAYGYLTPPRLADDLTGRSRPGLGLKHTSMVATSVSLLTDAAILAKYRETAIKTNDPSIQLSYAKYLLEIGEPSGHDSSSPTDVNPPRSLSAASNNTPPSSAPPSPTTLQQDAEAGKKQLTLEAIYWIDRLAKEGQPEAQFIRASWYEDGMYGHKKNADKALKWYQSSSKGDYGPAHYKVAYHCEKRKDSNKAVVLYKKAAIHNDVPANHRLAMVYLYGELGQSKNMKAGLQYLKRAASLAHESAPMSPYILGLILSREYSNQLVIPDDIAFPDEGEALEWFRKSAQLGYGPANYKLGYCYEYGSLGCNVDPYLSIQHYERAVQAGDGNGEAEMALSGWYLSGAENCFPADDQLAFKYAFLAAEKQLPKAQYAMGYYHEVGISVPVDVEKAMHFYKLSASNGNKDAAKRLEEQETTAHGELGHNNSIKRIKQGRRSKDQSCTIM